MISVVGLNACTAQKHAPNRALDQLRKYSEGLSFVILLIPSVWALRGLDILEEENAFLPLVPEPSLAK
jgi:hypothetical protein